jgi:hypothetical protein
MAVLSLIYLLKNNRVALIATYGVMIGGSALVGAATLSFDVGWLGPKSWMTLVGLGLFLAYVPYGCILFDRRVGRSRLRPRSMERGDSRGKPCAAGVVSRRDAPTLAC